MATKVLLKDGNENIILPITRGELILDSSGKEAFHSNEFVATNGQPGLMSVQDKNTLDSMPGELASLSTELDSLYGDVDQLKTKELALLTIAFNDGNTEDVDIFEYNGTQSKTVHIIGGDGINISYTDDKSVLFSSPLNSSTTAGLVASPPTENNANLVWKTDSEGNPVWGSIVTDQVKQQTITSNKNANYPILFGVRGTGDQTSHTMKHTSLSYNPGQGILTAPGFSGKYMGDINVSQIPDFPELNFAEKQHSHNTEQISLYGYDTSIETVQDLSNDITLTTALRYLENKANLGASAYSLVYAANNNDTIENLEEVLKVLKDIKDTEFISSLLGQYLPLAGGILNGSLQINHTNDNQAIIKYINNRIKGDEGYWNCNLITINDAQNKVHARFGMYGQNDKPEYLYLGHNNTLYNAWNIPNTLKLYSDKMTFGNTTITGSASILSQSNSLSLGAKDNSMVVCDGVLKAFKCGASDITLGSSTDPWSNIFATKINNTVLPDNPKFTDTTYDVFKGASTTSDGTSGLVPMPGSGTSTRFLRSDGEWATPTNTTNTAGGGPSAAKLYLVGRTSQSTGVTYTNKNVFMENGIISANGFNGVFHGSLAYPINIELDGAVTGECSFSDFSDASHAKITLTTEVNHHHDDRYYTCGEADLQFADSAYLEEFIAYAEETYAQQSQVSGYYALKDGSNATGTWGIDITGKADVLNYKVISSETDIDNNKTAKLYVGNGINWSGTINSMAYASILSIGNPERGFQIWSPRENALTPNGLRYRLGEQDLSSPQWGTEKIILDSGNFNTYSPALNGAGAQGTWDISILGDAGYAGVAGVANTLKVQRKSTSCDTIQCSKNQAILIEQATSSVNIPTDHYYHVLTTQGSDVGYATQLALGMTTDGMYYRNYQQSNGVSTWGSWKKVILEDKLQSSVNKGWYRIATSARDISNCTGIFELICNAARYHTICTFTAGTSYGRTDSTHINVISCGQYVNPSFTSVRIVYHTTYTDHYAYLEVECPADAVKNLVVKQVSGTGWNLIPATQQQSIPSGYSTKTIKLKADAISTTGYFEGKLHQGHLTWGGNNTAGAATPIGMAACSDLNANRLAYLNPDAIILEYSDNAGQSFYTAESVITNDTTLTEAKKTEQNTMLQRSKVSLVTVQDDNYYRIRIGNPKSSQVSTNLQTRITFVATSESLKQYFYTRPRKLLVHLSNAGHGTKMKVELKPATGQQWEEVGDYTISGWTGWNDIPFEKQFSLGSTYETNYRQLRLTFYINSVSSSNTGTLPTLYDIRLLGDAQWYASAHPLAKNNHMYTYDVLENVTFPANITTTGTITAGSFSGTASKASTVTLTGSAADYDYPVVLSAQSATAGNTTTATLYCDGDNTFKFNPSSNTVTATTFKGNLSGNASTADKLKTARNIKLTGSVTGNANFDGSGNIEISTTTNHNHSWATDITNAIVGGNEFNIGSSTESLNRFWFNYKGKDGNAFADDKLINDYLMGSGNGAHTTTANKYAFVTARGFKVGGQENNKYVVWSNGTTSALVAADIPNLDASKITSGTFDAARIPTGTSLKLYNSSTTSCPVVFASGSGSSSGTARTLYAESDLVYNSSSNALSCSGGFYETSDGRLKDIIKPITVDLEKLSKLRKVYFNWKGEESGSLQLGMIAQDVKELYPELVNEQNGRLSLAYDKLSVIALESVDILYKIINELKSEIKELKTKLTNYE